MCQARRLELKEYFLNELAKTSQVKYTRKSISFVDLYFPNDHYKLTQPRFPPCLSTQTKANSSASNISVY